MAASSAIADEVLYGETLVNTLYSDGNIAIRGYDSVAYHTQGKPVKGDAHYSFEYNGAKWLFASAKNRDLFAANPEKFAPAYGGYCAYGAGNGYLVKTEPEAFSIIDGKLYLNYNVAVSEKFQADLQSRIELAEKNWPSLKASVTK
ncbi:YHS domain-containing protein [Stappia sp. GBMRC 2046]|uniref:YHS domain-containing protein n=1 Tax=Stappia sediminis TaxID=2692190 RepID=A0A7X3LTT7_9HYPH|nr:YHS domain-containing (seleno)protein [Stappia sediminis]MXN64958.1 YHS domain-containing protein [Stappia sediminis]